MRFSRAIWILLVCAAVAACSSSKSNSRIDYEKATTKAPLDVPPPLKLPPAGADSVDMPAVAVPENAAVLPQPDNVRMQRAGDMQWLVVDAEPEQIWPRLGEFLKEQGLEIQREDASVGIIDTQWAENRADISQNLIRDLISKVAPALYGAPTRDKYRIRLGRGEVAKTTEIYLTHYGMEQVGKEETAKWQFRPSDPELVAEMLTRLMLKLGVPKERAQAVVAQKTEQAAPARFEGDSLVIGEGFDRAWRLVGIALDRVGLVVEDLDRSQGTYYVRQSEAFALPRAEDPKGWLSWFGSSEKPQESRFRLRVQGDDNASRVSVVSEQGEALPPSLAKEILTRVHDRLH